MGDLPPQNGDIKHSTNHFIAIIPPLKPLNDIVSLQKDLHKKTKETRIMWSDRYNIHICVTPLGYNLYSDKRVITVKEVCPFP